MVAYHPKTTPSAKKPVFGRIDDSGKVLLPISITASDAFELEIETLINLEFAGALVLPAPLLLRIGWRCLGARRVIIGADTHVVHQYLGHVSLGGTPLQSIIVLGGLREHAIIGQKLLSGRKLTVDFASGHVLLE